uniref:Predicted protein n=1 Tax=Physcomitrium patens TaxID=3218 RepID=A9U2D9_PHYPA
MENQQPADSTQEPSFADLPDETLRLSQPSRRRNRDEDLRERHVLPRIDGEIQRVWYHDLGRDSQCLVILLEVGTTPDAVPNILFEENYKGLNNDQITGWSSRPGWKEVNVGSGDRIEERGLWKSQSIRSFDAACVNLPELALLPACASHNHSETGSHHGSVNEKKEV